jgi:ElaB/YqjD/DUF883 family membrane-anchored ribosome-binding protein
MAESSRVAENLKVSLKDRISQARAKLANSKAIIEKSQDMIERSQRLIDGSPNHGSS